MFPDPLPPPASSSARTLRSVRIPTDMINVFHTSQMIPVIVSLIHAALETNLIREWLDQGLKDHKDYGRAAKEAMKTENERWEKERKTIEVGIKDKVQKAEVGLVVMTIFPTSSAAPETCQTLCTQYPDEQHREFFEDHRIEF